MTQQSLFSIKGLINQALLLSRVPIILGILVTPIRFGLELSGVPENAIFLIGALWLTIGVSIYWGYQLFDHLQAHWILVICLLIFSPISRIPIAVLWWIDNQFQIGSHYGLYFDNFPSALLNHITYGSLIQIVPGFIIGSIVIALLRNRKLKTSSK